MRRQADNVDVIPAKELAINHGARNIVEFTDAFRADTQPAWRADMSRRRETGIIRVNDVSKDLTKPFTAAIHVMVNNSFSRAINIHSTRIIG